MTMKPHRIAALVMALGASAAWAQSESAAPAEGDMTHIQSMDHMNHGAMHNMESAADESANSATMPGMNHQAMDHGERSPDYSDGQGFGPLGKEKMADDMSFFKILVDQLESARNRDKQMLTAYDFKAWFGRDYDRATIKAEGEYQGGHMQDSRTELLWTHAIAPFWDTQLGVRSDGGMGSSRTWAAFGVEGLAPYWFDVEATAYVGENGRTALRLAGSYDLLLTQRLILEPSAEVNVFGKSDAARDIGSGLSSATAGLRLRYEFSRKFAPYIGVEWSGKYGKTANIAVASGERSHDRQLVAGVRFWF